jgi:hypothetical protein
MVRKEEAQVLGSSSGHSSSDHSSSDQASSDQSWVLSSLEHDQLVRAKKHFIPRRLLKGPELVVLWALRIYLLFMMAVVVYQVWTAAH